MRSVALILCSAWLAAGPALAQAVPGMPVAPLTRPAGAVTDAPAPAQRQGGALALGGPAAPTQPAPAQSPRQAPAQRATTTRVDSSAGIPAVPQGMLTAANGGGTPVDAGAPALDLEIAALRANLGAGRLPVHELTLKSGRNEVVQIARNHLNRLVTPFANPVAKTTAAATSTSVEGQIVYVATSATEPVSMFVIDGDNPVNAISLTLLPRDVPAASVTLNLDGYVPGPSADSALPMRGEAGDDFVSVLRETLRALAQGEVPSGFGMRALTPGTPGAPECLMPGLAVSAAQVVTGKDLQVYVSKVTNRTGIPQSVDEQACASDQVVAVAAWPYVELMPGQSTELFVAVRRSAPQRGQSRPSLLN